MTSAFPVLSVSQLNATIKEILETGFPEIWVEGEVSGLRNTSSKHLYFSLKDDKALIRIVWFNWNSRPGVIPPEEGQKIRIQGRLTVYEAQGQYQIIVTKVEALGLGDLLAALERLKQKLAQEGLFDGDRKKTIPAYPQTIGLITSPTGAALQDMLRIFIQNKTPVSIKILPVPVQGTEAPEKIAAMIRYAEKNNLASLLVIGRGGGSVEDLLAFSDERVVRAIANCTLPIISAVGHEIDTPLSDLAADLRAPTPTAAAEQIAKPYRELQMNLSSLKSNFQDLIFQKIEKARSSASDFHKDRLEDTFHRVIQPTYQRLDDAKEGLLQNFKNQILKVKGNLSTQKAALEALSPQSILNRGFALVTNEQEQLVHQAKGVLQGQKLVIHWKDGEVITQAQEIKL